ncbi:MAG: hypothetical protein RMK57_09815 [Bryobacterales bacterium]|nr:hypothetical protein [Bryobacteraceae bacterium]MDW8354814.1 hypothetical protein [Bryobacterales bacterium]
MARGARVAYLMLLLLLALSLSAPLAQASVLTFGFRCITNNNATQCLIGQNQLFVDVVGFGSSTMIGTTTVTPAANEVVFRFYNTGPVPSSITDVYFDDGALLALASIFNMTGVNFSPALRLRICRGAPASAHRS